MDTINVLKSIEDAKKVEVALLTTFTIDLEILEKLVLNPLFNNGCKYAAVFVDENQFQEQIQSDPNVCYLGTKYLVHSILTPASFHPKMMLLLGQDSAKLMIGSGNLTASGLISNYEYFSEFTYNSRETECLPIIQAAYQIFIDLYSIVEGENKELYLCDEEVREKLLSYKYLQTNPTVQTAHNFLFANLRQSLLDQFIPHISGEIQAIDICVPFFDRDLRAIKALVDHFGCQKIHIYLQNKTSNFPKWAMEGLDQKIDASIQVFDSILLADGRQNTQKRYHGKILRFTSVEHDYIVYGSPNCSHLALLRTFREGGNFETAILGIGDPGQFNEFFADLNTVSTGSQSLDTLEQQEQEPADEFEKIRFLSASFADSFLNCVFMARLKQPVQSVTCDGLAGEMTFHEETLKVSFPIEGFKQDKLIFTVEFVFDDHKIDKTCWLIKVDELAKFRSSDANRPISRINGMEDLEDCEFLTEIINQCITEMKFSFHDSASDLRVIQNRPVEQTVEVSEPNSNPDEYFVSDETNRVGYRLLQKLRESNPLSYFASLFFANMFKEIKIDMQAGERATPELNGHTTSDVQARAKLEDAVRRFINGYLNGIKAKPYIEQADDGSFLEYQVIFLKIVTAIYENHLLKDTLNHLFMMDLYLKLAEITAFKLDFQKLDNEKRDYAVSTILIAMIIALNTIDQIEDIDRVNEIRKKVHAIVNRLDHVGIEFRNQYLNYNDSIEAYIAKIIPHSSMSRAKLEMILDPIFGYKTWDQLILFLKNKYNSDVKMQLDLDGVSIEVQTAKPSLKHDLEEFKLALRTMERYNEHKTSFLYLDPGSSGIIKMKIEITNGFATSQRTIWRRNGKCEKESIPSPLTKISF